MGTQTTAFLLSCAAASTTMLGWAAVAAKRSWTPRSIGAALVISAAAMLAVSLIELLPPGLGDPTTRVRTIVLFALGAGLVPILRTVLERMQPTLGALESASMLVMLSICLHNVPEGTVVYAATLVSLEAGLVTAVAIALHNIPEGMAVATAVIAAGGTRLRAMWFTAISMLGEILGAMAMFALGRSLNPGSATAVLALVAGIMVALSVTQLIPAGVRLVRDDILAAQTEASI